MISEDQRTKIRRLFFAEHWPIGTIASELGLHHDTVELAIEPRRFIKRGLISSVSLLEPYRAFVEQTLEQHPRLRATRLYEMIRDRGYTGSIYAVRRHVRKARPVSRHEAFFRLTVLPGEQAQVDWGSFGKIVAVALDEERERILLAFTCAMRKAVSSSSTRSPRRPPTR